MGTNCQRVANLLLLGPQLVFLTLNLSENNLSIGKLVAMTPVAVPTSSSHQATGASVSRCVESYVATVGRSDAALCRPLVASLCFVQETGREEGA